MSFPVTLKGRLGADPDITFAASGTAIAKLRIVTNGRRLVDGSWEDVDTSWWNVTAFGKTAEALTDHLHKGDLVVVIGKIKQRDWEKDGVKRTSAEITADDVARLVKAGHTPSKGAAAQDQGWPDAPAPF